MKYLKHFNQQLRTFRETKRLSIEDVSNFCLVDESVVASWESEDGSVRCYPTLDNILDLCLKTGAALEYFLDLPDSRNRQQLELPGLTFIEDADLNESLEELGEHLDNVIPADDEQELLRRYRKSDAQSKELILQLIAN